MKDLFQYWLGSSFVWLSLLGGILALIFNFYGMGEMERSRHPKKLIAGSILYIIFSCFLLGKSNRDAGKANLKLQEKIDLQTLMISDIRNQNNKLISFFQNNTAVTANPPSPPPSQSSKDLVIKNLRKFISWGEDKIQVEGTKTDVSIDDYRKNRNEWLNAIHDFLLNEIIQRNKKWKDWAGGNGCDESFDCRDDLREIDYPVGCPEDRKSFFRDNSRRINNPKYYLTELGA
jgi:hypothetical protein